MNKKSAKKILADYSEFYVVCRAVFEQMCERAEPDEEHKCISGLWMKYYNSAIIGTDPVDPDFVEFVRISVHGILSYISRFAEMEDQQQWYFQKGIPMLKDAFGSLMEPLGNDIFPSHQRKPTKPVPYDSGKEKYTQNKKDAIGILDSVLEHADGETTAN